MMVTGTQQMAGQKARKHCVCSAACLQV